MRIGILGGSFDPIHFAHLLMADAAFEQLNLEQVRFMPAAQSPLKQDRPPILAKHRCEMITLAINSDPRFAMDDREVRRQGVSYTVDTLREIRSEHPTAEFFLIIGGDSLLDFAKWKEPEAICALATIAVAHRGGLEAPDFDILRPFVADDQRLAQIRSCQLLLPVMEISSTDIRTRVHAGRSIRYRLPAAVAAYIDSNQIYQ